MYVIEVGSYSLW